jgi:hypothetical protein
VPVRKKHRHFYYPTITSTLIATLTCTPAYAAMPMATTKQTAIISMSFMRISCDFVVSESYVHLPLV